MKKTTFFIIFLYTYLALSAQSERLLDSLAGIYTTIEAYKASPFLEVSTKGKLAFSKPKTEAIYDEISSSSSGFIAAKRNGFWGLVDSTGKEVGNWNYTSLSFGENPYSIIKQKWTSMRNGKKGYITAAAKEIFPPIYDEINQVNFGYELVNEGKVGFADKEGNIRIPLVFLYEHYKDSRRIMSIYDHKYLILSKDSLQGVWRMTDFKQIIAPIYDKIQLSFAGFLVEKAGKQGFIDTTGKIIIPITHLKINNISYRNTYLASDKKIKRVVPKRTKEEDVINNWGTYLAENMTTCAQDSAEIYLWGLYDSLGRELLPQIYDALYFWGKEVFYIEQNGKKGLIHLNGKPILDTEFEKLNRIYAKTVFIYAQKDTQKRIYSFDGKLLQKDFEEYFVARTQQGRFLWLYEADTWYLLDSLGNVCKTYTFDKGSSSYKMVDNYELIIGEIKGKKYFIAPNGKIMAIGDYELEDSYNNYYLFVKNIQKKDDFISNFLLFNEKGEKIYSLRHGDDISFNSDYHIIPIEKKEKYAYLNLKTGKQITPFRYEWAEDFENGVAEVTDMRDHDFYIDTLGRKVKNYVPPTHFYFEYALQQTNTGLIDTFGRSIIAPKSQTISVYNTFIETRQKDTKTDEIFDYQGKRLFSGYELRGSKGKYVLLKDSTGKMGVMQLDGKVVLPFEYDKLAREGKIWIAKKNKKWGMLSYTGKAMTAFRYQDINYCSPNTYAVKIHKKWHLVDSVGHVWNSQKFDEINIPTFGNFPLVVINKKGKYALMNDKGKQITPFMPPLIDEDYNTFVSPIKEKYDMMWVSDKNGTYLVSSTGKISQKYDTVVLKDYRFSHYPYIQVQKNNFWGMIDSTFQEILPPIYANILISRNNYHILQKADKKYVLFSPHQQKIVSEAYTYIEKWAGNLIAFSPDGTHFGYMDTLGKVVIAPQYELAGTFIGNKTVVQFAGKSGVIDSNGNWLLKPEYEALGIFANGYICAKENCNFRLFSPDCQAISQEYDMISQAKDNFLVLKGEKMTYLDSTGKEIAPCIFEKMIRKDKDFLIVGEQGKEGVWDIKKQALIIPYLVLRDSIWILHIFGREMKLICMAS